MQIITINREFGSGGRELGKRLADGLGFAYYDRYILEELSKKLAIDENYLEVVKPALEKKRKSNKQAVAIKLANNKIITGKESDLLSPVSAMIINAIKELAKIPDRIDLLAPNLIEPILKNRPNGSNEPLKLSEVLIALSICSVTNPTVEKALSCIKKLETCDAHSTYILPNDEIKALKSLKINITCEPKFYSEDAFIY